MVGAIVVTVIAELAIVVPAVLLIRRRYQKSIARFPWQVARHVSAHPGERYTIEIPSAGGVWNPARGTRIDYGIEFGHGTATYLLTADGTVRMWFRAAGKEPLYREGPLPLELLEASPMGELRRRSRRIIAEVLLIVAVGFTIGMSLSGGSTGHRLTWGAVDGFAGFFAAYFALMGRAVTSFFAGSSAEASRQDPTP